MATTEGVKFPLTVIAILTWLALVRTFDPVVIYSVELGSQTQKTVYDSASSGVSLIFYLLLPFIGLLADVKFGRLNIAIVSVIIGAICTLICVILSVMSHNNLIIFVILPLVLYTHFNFEVVVLSLGTDLLIEMSSRSSLLSSFVWWHYWFITLGTMITALGGCFLKSKPHDNTYVTSIHFICLIIILMSAIIIKRKLIHYRSTENPFKVIIGVLYFALKHKSPLKRSALTYWEEMEPSRINLGKSKYGGPYQEKDVESVKTLFRILPLVATVTMISFPYEVLGRVSFNVSVEKCLITGSYFIHYCITLIVVPVYQFIVKRYCHCYQIKMTMLQKIGVGICLSILGKLGYLLIDLYISIPVYLSHNDTVCIFNTASAQDNTTIATNINDLYVNHSYLFILPNIVSSFGALFIMPGSLEFVFAQSPYNMRGMLIGLWYALSEVYQTAGWLMIQPFKLLQDYLIPSCESYVLLMNFLFMLICLILFAILSRWYKLHRHEDVFNVHQTAECYYENEFNRRDTARCHYGSISSSLQHHS